MVLRAKLLAAVASAVLGLGPASAADTDVVINEVFYTGPPAEDWIELKNTGNETIDVNDWFVCAQFAYLELSQLPLLDGDDLVLLPGEIVTLSSFIPLDNASDLGLYTAFAFVDTSRMVDFVQWGTPNEVGRSGVAAAKGIWTESSPGVYDFVPTAAAGESAAWDGANSGGGLLTLGTDFANGVPTRGQDNVIQVEPTTWAGVKDRYRDE